MNDSNDSLYTTNRIIQTQNIVNSEQQRIRDLKEAKKDYDYSIRQNALIGFLIFLGILSMILILNNRQKQKVNSLLLDKNKEIILQKSEIEKTIEQKQILLSELQHRVKNNLQYVISILEIQKESINFSNIDDLIKNNQNRIHSIAMLHKKLNVDDSVNDVEVNRYVNELADLVKDSYVNEKKDVELQVNCELQSLPISKAMPIGLIIVELVSNSMKYAFTPEKKGLIKITISEEEGTKIKKLHYADNGVGYDFNNAHSKGLGVEIIKGLIDQLNGTIETNNQSGFALSISFK